MKHIDVENLLIALNDSGARLEDAFPSKETTSQPTFEPTSWQRQGDKQLGYNSHGYTGEVRHA